MIIGLDLDDVLFQANESLARFHNGRYGTSYDRHMVRSWHFEELWGCTTEEVIRRIGEWYDTHEHHTSNPVTGAADALAQLAEHHTLLIVTARSPNVREQTMAWVKRHLPQVFKGIHFTNHAPKATFCKDLGVQLFVEDAPHHAHDVAQSGIPVLLFDTPWNQEVSGERITRVTSWKEALTRILHLTRP